jgi:hypothetical protein
LHRVLLEQQNHSKCQNMVTRLLLLLLLSFIPPAAHAMTFTFAQCHPASLTWCVKV